MSQLWRNDGRSNRVNGRFAYYYQIILTVFYMKNPSAKTRKNC